MFRGHPHTCLWTATFRNPFTTKAHTLNAVQDTTSGPNLPDVEMVGGGIAFLALSSKLGATWYPWLKGKASLVSPGCEYWLVDLTRGDV
jgi:hypothetical protein